jgi:hypothetical protein
MLYCLEDNKAILNFEFIILNQFFNLEIIIIRFQSKFINDKSSLQNH